MVAALFLSSLLLSLVMPLARGQVVCRSQSLPAITRSLRLSLGGADSAFRSHRGPSSPGFSFEQRSIVRCQRDVEVLSVPQAATAYEGVSLGGVVTIVETDAPLTDTELIEQVALPACSGVFVSEGLVLSSAHWYVANESRMFSNVLCEGR